MSSAGGSKSPGKGGKSLELMQKRMQQQQQNQQQPQAPQQQQQQPMQGSVPSQQHHPIGAPMTHHPAPMAPPQHQLPEASAANPLDLTQCIQGSTSTTNTNPQTQQGQGQPPHPSQQGQGQPSQVRYPSNQVASSKPKGKDFSRMSIQAPRPVPVQPNNLVPSPRQQQQHQQQPPPQHQQQQPQQQAQPKGKDFSAMANRMTPESRARAAAMQAGAREAAGMPPLNRPTATSVAATTMPPMMSYPLPGMQQQQQHPPQQHGVVYMGSTGGATPTGTGQTTQGGSYHRRDSYPGPSSSAAATSTTPGVSTKPTPAPSAKEGLLASPHMAPLVGPRVRDLLKSIDPSYTIEATAEKQVLELLDDFLEKVCKQSIRLASHRGSKSMEVQDVQLILAKQWGITIPGLGPPAQKGNRFKSEHHKKRKAAATSSSSKVQKTEDERSGSQAL